MYEKKVGILDATKLFFQNFTNFSGRSRRSEYWWWCLVNMIISTVIGAILPDFAWIWTVVIFIPTLSLCVRRLHDIGKSGWSYLWVLLPLVGGIMMIIWFCKDSEPGANQYGPNPKY